jgi:hypothetical protein
MLKENCKFNVVVSTGKVIQEKRLQNENYDSKTKSKDNSKFNRTVNTGRMLQEKRLPFQ